MRRYAVVVLFCVSYVFARASDDIPPDLDRGPKLACTARQSTIDGRTYWWHVIVRAEYPDGREPWHKVYAIRPGAQSSEAIRDCERWLNRVRKASQKRKEK